MIKKLLKIIPFYLFTLSIHLVQSQKLYLSNEDGVNKEFPIDEIRKIHFSANELIITSKNNTFPTDSFSLANLNHLRSTDIITTFNELNSNDDLSVFPNPVLHSLNVDVSNYPNINTSITLLNLEGQIVHTTTVNNVDIVHIDVSALAQGLYICKFQSKDVIKIAKIIKK